MTSATALPTARDLLLGARDDAAALLAQALDDRELLEGVDSALGRLSPSARRLVRARLAAAAADLAAVSVADVVVAGWQRAAALVDSAWRTRDDPSGEEVVDLAAHRITSTHRPRVDVLVDDVVVGSLPLVVTVEVLVRALAATVRGGRLVALETGRCRLAATLACAGVTLAAREVEVDLGAVLPLGEGVPLVPVARPPAAP